MSIKGNLALLAAFAAAALVLSSSKDRHPSAAEQSGDAAFVRHEVEAAIRHWEQALAESPSPSEGLYQKLVSACIITRDFPRARRHAEDGLTHFPACATLQVNLALVAFYQERYEETLALTQRVLAANDHQPDAHYLRALVYERYGRREDARQELVKEVNVNPGSRRAWERLQEYADEKP